MAAKIVKIRHSPHIPHVPLVPHVPHVPTFPPIVKKIFFRLCLQIKKLYIRTLIVLCA